MTSIPKLRSYFKFKTTIGPENYILISISKSVRSLLAQLRCRVLPLAIETGRFTRKEISERKCILCNSGAMEDEQHFICNCTLYDDFRINLFNDAEKCMPGSFLGTEEDKFTYIMSFDNLTSSLYRFVRTAWNKRQNTFNNFMNNYANLC